MYGVLNISLYSIHLYGFAFSLNFGDFCFCKRAALSVCLLVIYKLLNLDI